MQHKKSNLITIDLGTFDISMPSDRKKLCQFFNEEPRDYFGENGYNDKICLSIKEDGFFLETYSSHKVRGEYFYIKKYYPKSGLKPNVVAEGQWREGDEDGSIELRLFSGDD